MALEQPTIQLAPQSAVTLPNYDLHTHTVYCGHADNESTVANLIARARDLGLACLGISDHLMDVIDQDYMQAIRQDIQAVTSPGIAVLFGVEMDLDTTDPSGNWIVPGFQSDYVILSAHGFPRFDLDIPATERTLPPDLQRRNLARKWLAWYRNGIAHPGIHILGHPLREPINMGLIPLQDVELFEEVIDVFTPAIDHGVAFELNNAFLGYLDDTPQYAPYIRLIRELKKRGMRFSRGSDSHSLASIGACDWIAQAAEAAQFVPEDWMDLNSLIQ